MQLEAHRSDLEASVTKLEKSLLENDPQNFITQKLRRTLFGQGRLQPVAAIQCQQFAFNWDARKFEQVERSIHGVDRKKPRWCPRIFDAVQEIRNVRIRDSPQRPAAHPPIERGNACAGKCAHSLFLSHVRLQSADHVYAHRNSFGAPTGSKSKVPRPWPATEG